MDFALQEPTDFDSKDEYAQELARRLFEGDVILRYEKTEQGRSFGEGSQRLPVSVATKSFLQATGGMPEMYDEELYQEVKSGRLREVFSALRERAQQVFDLQEGPPVRFIERVRVYWKNRLQDEGYWRTLEEALEEGGHRKQ